MSAGRGGAVLLWLALVAADALFLWMFLSVAPFEAASEQFVADWRHGMAGNSPSYMPGFFALAAAA